MAFEFEFDDRAVYLPSTGTLVCADLHVGRDASSDLQVPVGEHEDLTARLGGLLERYDPTEVIFAGDLLHSFDRVPTGASTTLSAISELAGDDRQIRVVSGNHDTMLGELWDGTPTAEYHVDAKTVVTHGHVAPETDTARYVIGHDHPTIEIEGVRRPCYLYDPSQYEGAEVLMLPSFSRLPAGVVVNDLSASDFQSPFVTDAGALRPIVLDDAGDVHEFPPLRELRQYL